MVNAFFRRVHRQSNSAEYTYAYVPYCGSAHVPPLKFPCTWGPGPPPNTWFLGPSLVSLPNGISTGLSVFAHSARMSQHTDTQTTLRATSIAIGRMHRVQRCGVKTINAVYHKKVWYIAVRNKQNRKNQLLSKAQTW